MSLHNNTYNYQHLLHSAYTLTTSPKHLTKCQNVFFYMHLMFNIFLKCTLINVFNYRSINGYFLVFQRMSIDDHLSYRIVSNIHYYIIFIEKTRSQKEQKLYIALLISSCIIMTRSIINKHCLSLLHPGLTKYNTS